MRDARTGTAGKPARPHHVAALKHADAVEAKQRQVQAVVDNYAKNPRASAKQLHSLGMSAEFIRTVHHSSVPNKKTQPVMNVGKALQSGSLFHNFTGVKLLDRGVNDLTTAAVYSPAGIYQAGKAVGGDIGSTARGKPTLGRTGHLGKEIAKGVAGDLRHPLRHPGFTGLDVLGIATPVVGAGARIGAGASRLAAGEGARASLRAVLTKPKPGRITYRTGDLTVETPASKNPILRAGQKAHAAHLNRRPDSPALKRRIATALERQTHFAGEAARAPSNLLAGQGRKLSKPEQMALRVVAEGKPISERIRFHREQGAKATSRVERADHARQIRLLRAADKYVTHGDGVPRISLDSPKLGRIYGHLKTVDAQREKILVDTDQLTSLGAEARKHGPGRVIEGATYERTPAQKGRVAQVREYPGRSKTVTRPRSEHEARIRLEKLDADYEKMVGHVAQTNERPGDFADLTRRRNMQAKKRANRGLPPLPKVSDELRVRAEKDLARASEGSTPYAKKLQKFLIEREQLRDSLNERAFNGNTSLGDVTQTIPGKPRRVHLREVKAQRASEGLVGAEGFKGGDAYIPAFKSEPRGGTGGVSSTGNVIGKVRKVVSRNKHFTGQGMRLGQIPGNTTGLVSRQGLRAVRYLQSDRFRKQVLKAGTDERRSEHDVLVSEAIDKGGTPAKISPEAKAVVGKENYTLDELSGHTTAFEDFRRKLFPMQHRNDYTALSAEDRLVAQDGGKVKGYKWVDERLLRGVNRAGRSVQTRTGKAAVNLVDSINNASKMAILYLKPAYAIPNVAGNAFLNLVQQGFAAPRNLKRSAYLSHKIGDTAAATLDSLMGEGVAQSIASDAGIGQRAVNVAAGKWSKVVDLPFRRASFIHEARKLGFSTPEKLKALLTDEQHHADLLEAAQRANDSIIDYSRLSDFEKGVVRRVIFFYPWVKGSTRYAGHYITEHPTQAAITAHLAEIGKEKSGLGPVPSYEQGAFKVAGKLVNPAAAGIFGTSAQVVQAATGAADQAFHGKTPKQASRLTEFLTPAAGVADALLTGEDSRGFKFRPGDNIFRKTLVDSLPQAALLRRTQALRSGADQSRKLFPVKDWKDVAAPFVVGGIAPRSYNPQALHGEAQREQQSQRTSLENARLKYRDHRVELEHAVRKVGGQRIPQPVLGRLNLRLERKVARTKEKDPLVADINVIERHGWMSKQEAANARRWVQSASKSDRRSLSGDFTEKFFDRPGQITLSGFYAWLREQGVDLYAPDL